MLSYLRFPFAMEIVPTSEPWSSLRIQLDYSIVMDRYLFP